jgi:FG-GAP repeat
MKHICLLASLILTASWAVGAEFTAPDGLTEGRFGAGVAVSGNTLAVITPIVLGYYQDYPGRLYIYTKTGKRWEEPTLTAELYSPVGGGFDSVAIFGTTIVVGEPDCSPTGVGYTGCAFVYEQVNGTWQLVAQLTPSDPSYEAEFGSSVAYSDKTIVVGEMGWSGNEEAYVFTEPQSGWASATETAILTPKAKGTAPFGFGYSVAVNAYFVAVGSPNDSNGTADYYGAVYVYQEPVGGWQSMNETAKLTDGSGTEGRLGYAITMQLSAIVAAEANYPASQASIYLPVNGTWVTTDRASAALGPIQDCAVSQLAMNDATILVGSCTDGIAVFRKPAGGWVNAVPKTYIDPLGGGQNYLGSGLDGTSMAVEGNAVAFVGLPFASVGSHGYEGKMYIGALP